jgi:hypothetical protein
VRFKDFISEAFDSKINYDIETNDADYLKAAAMIGGRKIVMVAWKEHLEGPDVWGIEFYQLKDDGSKTYKLTGSGGQMQVMSFWKQFIELLISMHQPARIVFTAETQNGRADVYKKVLPKFNIQKYTLSTKHNGDDEEFDLTRDD